jgi:hypothetical protein
MVRDVHGVNSYEASARTIFIPIYDLPKQETLYSAKVVPRIHFRAVVSPTRARNDSCRTPGNTVWELYLTTTVENLKVGFVPLGEVPIENEDGM